MRKVGLVPVDTVQHPACSQEHLSVGLSLKETLITSASRYVRPLFHYISLFVSLSLLAATFRCQWCEMTFIGIFFLEKKIIVHITQCRLPVLKDACAELIPKPARKADTWYCGCTKKVMFQKHTVRHCHSPQMTETYYSTWKGYEYYRTLRANNFLESFNCHVINMNDTIRFLFRLVWGWWWTEERKRRFQLHPRPFLCNISTVW